MKSYSLLLVTIHAVFCLNISAGDGQGQPSLAASLATCYLQAAKTDRSTWYYKDYTDEQKIFGKESKGSTASVHDVTLKISKSDVDKNVTLTAEVFGAPEEFNGEHVLDSEKSLLKYKLIYAYLAQRDRLNARFFAWFRGDDWTLDQATKIAALPNNHREIDPTWILGTRWRVYRNKFVMKIEAMLSEQEFNALVQKHFSAKTA